MKLRLEEIVAARPNGSSHFSAVSVSQMKKESRILFISGSNAFIYNADFKLIFSISTPLKLECCAIQSGTDTIALSGESQILFYYPEVKKAGIVWEMVSEYTHQSHITSLNWGSNAELLVGGEILSILQRNPLSVEMTVLYSVELPFKATKCIYSPCSTFFAVLGKNHRHLMVWYKRMRLEKEFYDYVLLSHPAPIADFSWRDPSSERTVRAALMTHCEDNVSRFWSQADSQYGFQSFSLAGAIDPSGHIFGNQSPVRGSSEKKSSMQWLTGKALASAILQQRDLYDFKESLHEKHENKLLDTIHEFPDMIFQVSPSGTMSIWGIQGLGVIPHRVTKINLILRTESCVQRSDSSFFESNIKSIFLHSSKVCVSPEIVFLTCRAGDQVMNAYGMDLNDFFTNDWNSPRLTLKHSFCGPKTPLVRLKRHPVFSYLAAQEESGGLSIFDTRALETLRLPNSTGLLVSSVLPEGWNCVEFEWLQIAANSLLLLSDLKNVYIYDVHLSCLGMLPDSLAIVSLFVYAGDGPMSNVVVGLDEKSETVKFWSLVLGQEGDIQSEILCRKPSEFGKHLFQPCSFTFSNSIRFAEYSSILSEFDPSTKSISCWHWNNLDTPVTLASLKGQKPLSLVKVWSKRLFDDVEQVLHWKPSSFGKLAVVYTSKNEYYIDIWDNEYTGLEICIEARLPFRSEQIVSIDWQTTFDGQHLLAVATRKSITIFSKSHINKELLWVSVGLYEEADRDIDIKSAAWISNGHILLSTNKLCKVVSPWFCESDSSKLDASLFERSSLHSSRLQDYDPSLLSYYIIWGKSDLVRFNLSLLHRFVKLSIETGRACVHIPVPLWKLLEEKGDSSQQKTGYDDLFEHPNNSASEELGVFTQEHTSFLVENLSKSGLPNFKSLIAFIQAFNQLEQHQKSLDENGLRFFLNAAYLIRTGEEKVLAADQFVWAFFSESQDYLLESLTQALGGTMRWKEARSMGIGYWISNSNTLKQTFETIARNQYWGADGIHDPVACSLFYFALKKKNVLLGLWKLAGTHPEQPAMLKFLANNFDEERWKTAALKNAFALLGKQRYEYAAAFFLLGGKLKDAANVCVKQLNDPQLAICICRIYEGNDGPVLNELLSASLLPMACQAGDRWLSCLLWTLAGKRDNAFYSISRPLIDLLPPQSEKLASSPPVNDPKLLILLSHLKQAYKKLIMASVPGLSPLEEGLFRAECVKAYDQIGCPGLALQMILEYKMDTLPELQLVSAAPSAGPTEAATATPGPLHIDWSSPSGGGLDWGEPSVPQAASGLDWGELDAPKSSGGGLDWGQLEVSKPAASGLDWGELESSAIMDDLLLTESIVKNEVAAAPVSSAPSESVLVVTENEALRIRVKHIDIAAYKKILVLRILHDLHNSSMAVVTFKKELETDKILSNYFVNVKLGLMALSKASNLSLIDIGKLMASRSFEMHVMDAYAELVPFGDDAALSSFLAKTESMFVQQTKFLVSKCFDQETPGAERVLYADTMSKNIIQIWCSWQHKIRAQSLQSSDSGKTNRLWWILGLCEQFFDFLLKANLKGLSQLISDLLADHPPIAHPDADDSAINGGGAVSSEAVDLYDEFGIALYQKDSFESFAAEKFIHCLLLCHILSSLRTFLDRLAEIMNLNTTMDSTFIFLSEAVEKSLLHFAFQLESEVAEKWRKHNMTLVNMPAYILELQLSDLWSLIKRTADTKASATAILRIKPRRVLEKGNGGSLYVDGKNIDDKETEERVRSTLIVTSPIPIVAFVVNPLDSTQLAYITNSYINEIDTATSRNYYGMNPNPREIGSRENMAASFSVSANTSPSRGAGVGKDIFNVKRNLSFDSAAKLVKRPFYTTHVNDSAMADKGLRMNRPVKTGTALESHHSLNYFLAGCGDNSSPNVCVDLFQFGQTEALVEYRAESEGKLTKCHFDPYGAKFGGADTRGNLHIWKFDSSASTIAPSITLRQCHEGAVNDFAFVNSSSIIATAGMSSVEMNVSVWDTLLPVGIGRVQSFSIGEAGISTLVYSARYNLLIAGGKKGKIFVMDVRKTISLVNSFDAHESMVRSMAINPTNSTLVSGSTKGDIKIWDIKAISAVDTPPSTSYNPWPLEYDQSQALGVAQVHVVNEDIYNCWGNGHLFSSRLFRQ